MKILLWKTTSPWIWLWSTILSWRIINWDYFQIIWTSSKKKKKMKKHKLVGGGVKDMAVLFTSIIYLLLKKKMNKTSAQWLDMAKKWEHYPKLYYHLWKIMMSVQNRNCLKYYSLFQRDQDTFICKAWNSASQSASGSWCVNIYYHVVKILKFDQLTMETFIVFCLFSPPSPLSTVKTFFSAFWPIVYG